MKTTSLLENFFLVTIGRWSLVAALISPAAAQYPQWLHKTTIIMNTTATGANVAADVKGFPVGINLNSTNFNFSEAKAKGEDIRFSLGTTPLAYQIESWDNVTQKAALWVKVDVKGN